MSNYAQLKAYVAGFKSDCAELRSIWHNLHSGAYASMTDKEWLSLRRMVQRRITK